MPVKRRVGKDRVGGVPEAMWCAMMDQPLPEDCTRFERYFITHHRDRASHGPSMRVRDYWDQHREAVLAEFTRDQPGTRPRCWWDWDAPREPVGTRPGMWDDGERCLARRHVGGGASELQPSDMDAYLLRGVPVTWGRWWGEYQADPLGSTLPVAAPSASRPAPLYESEATYLRRLGLLLPGELQRLTARDFGPEAVVQFLDGARRD